MTPSDNHDDPPLDDQDLMAIAALTQDDLVAIDQALLANSGGEWKKVALVVSMAMDAHPDRYHDIPDIFYGQRVMELVASGELESQGNLRRMRFSEIRLASAGRHEA
ncbi:MAG TPA: DUF3658 domain-containing protein [Pseudoxanthomonas sp.]|nr:DUF3658 domain-containing protein [Pseudoxanthomonas sp.]